METSTNEEYLELFKESLESIDKNITITDFGNEPYELVRPIPILIRIDDDYEFIACFPEANLAASSEAKYKAVNMLKSVILDTYEHLSEMEDDKLGAALQKQKKILLGLIKKK